MLVVTISVYSVKEKLPNVATCYTCNMNNFAAEYIPDISDLKN